MITEHWCHGHWSQIWYHDFKYVERKYNFNLQQTKAKKSCKTGWMPRWSSLHPMLSLRLTHNLEQYFDWAGACDPCLWLVELVGCCEVTAVAGGRCRDLHSCSCLIFALHCVESLRMSVLHAMQWVSFFRYNKHKMVSPFERRFNIAITSCSVLHDHIVAGRPLAGLLFGYRNWPTAPGIWYLFT